MERPLIEPNGDAREQVFQCEIADVTDLDTAVDDFTKIRQRFDRDLEGFQRPDDRANNSRSWWPSQSARNVAGYVYYHPYIARDVGYNIRNHVAHDHNDGSVDYLVGGYNCRTIRGSTSWSVHAFGAAIDTNSARNPLGQSFWNGKGADGYDYGRYLPNVWRGPYPGHGFFWGINWDSRPDPMHFQYVTDY